MCVFRWRYAPLRWPSRGGADIDAQRAEDLACGSSPVEDITAAQLGPLLRDGTYQPTATPDDAAGFDVAVIAGPTHCTTR
ncbi:hypothetical protein [Streptomyces griseofuscus]|uniref:hypothetical protein n=1 Tax=Streptomyces griseofuscus TaxID=146922 RepID=UPI000A778E21|nr:hypothetical protein [Streptomyces griseofuscus]